MTKSTLRSLEANGWLYNLLLPQHVLFKAGMSFQDSRLAMLYLAGKVDLPPDDWAEFAPGRLMKIKSEKETIIVERHPTEEQYYRVSMKDSQGRVLVLS